MSPEVKVRSMGEGKFFVEVPQGNNSAKVMADTVRLLRASKEKVLTVELMEGGFSIEVVQKEGTFSALVSAATNALEWIGIGSG